MICPGQWIDLWTLKWLKQCCSGARCIDVTGIMALIKEFNDMGEMWFFVWLQHTEHESPAHCFIQSQNVTFSKWPTDSLLSWCLGARPSYRNAFMCAKWGGVMYSWASDSLYSFCSCLQPGLCSQLCKDRCEECTCAFRLFLSQHPPLPSRLEGCFSCTGLNAIVRLTWINSYLHNPIP